MHPRSKRIGRVSRTASTTASSVRGCAGRCRSIRTAIDGNDLAGAKSALKQTISLIDKMASKGIIHRNAAGRYKSRLTTRIAHSPAEIRRTQRPDARPGSHAHNSTTSRSSRTRGSPADRFRSRSVRNSASTAGRSSPARCTGNFVRTSQPSCPRIFSGGAPGVEHQRELPQRRRAVSRLDGIGHRPVVLQRRRPDDLPHIVERNRLLPQRVEQQPIDVVPQPLDVRCRRARRAAARRPDRSATSAAATRVCDPALGVRLSPRSTPHSTSVACFDSSLYIRLRLSSGAGDQHERRLRLRLLEAAPRARPSARVAASLSRFGTSSASACSTMTTRRGAIIGSVRAAATSDGDAGGEPVAGRHVAGVDALDVERAQPFVDQLLELVRRAPTSRRRLRPAAGRADPGRAGLRFACGRRRRDRLDAARIRGVTSERLEDRADDRAGEVGGHAIERVGVLAEERGRIERGLARSALRIPAGTPGWGSPTAPCSRARRAARPARSS